MVYSSKYVRNLQKSILYFLIMIISLFGCQLLLDASEQEELSADKLLEDAKIYIKQKYYQEALDNINKILQLYPDSRELEEAYYLIGDCYNTDIDLFRDLNAAQSAYQKAIDLYPESEFKENTYYKLASVFERKGNLLDASLIYGVIIKEFPESTNSELAEYSYAESEYLLGNPKEAVNKFSAFIKKYPDSKDVVKCYYRVADCFFMQFDYDLSLEYYNIALNKYSDYIINKPTLLFRIAEVNYQVDNFDKAEEFFLKYNNFFPDHESTPDAIMRIGDCLFFKTDNRRALFFYKEVIERYPDSKAAYLSEIKKFGIEVEENPINKPDFKKLRVLMDKVTPSDPQVAVINYRIAEILFVSGYPEEAYNVAVKSLEYGIDRSIEKKCFELRLIAMLKMFQTFTKQRKYMDIVKFFVKDKNRFLREDYTPEIFYLLSHALYNLSNFIDAKDYLSFIPAEFLTKEEYIWLEIKIYNALGLTEKIIPACKRFQNMYPESENINSSRYILANAYYHESEYKKAIDYYKKAFSNSGDNVDSMSYFYIGLSYYKIQNFKDALRFLKKAEKVLLNKDKGEKDEPDEISDSISSSIEQISIAIPNSYYYLGEIQDALNYFLQFIKKFPDSKDIPYVLYRTGNIYLKQDKVENAKKYLDDLMNNYKGSFWSNQAKMLLDSYKINKSYAEN